MIGIRTIGLMATNRLLAKLRRKDRLRPIAACDEIDLCIGDVLWEPQQRIPSVYFPVGAFVSQLVPVHSRENLELALVQGSGSALRLSAASFRRELEQMPALRQLLNRYICVLQAQLALTAACISFHSLDLRLARWLLMTHDRAGLGSFHLTHEFLAQMLGVRRVGITNAAGILQKRKLLHYSRGEITVLDRNGPEKSSCSCYQASRDAYENVLGKSAVT
jgi:hypothetical protein